MDPSLVKKAQDGDQIARERVLQWLTPIFRSYFRSKIGQQSAVSDLVQNSLLRVHSGLEHLKYPDRFKGFAMKAALFELHDYYRGRHSAKERLYEPELLPEDADESGKWAGSSIDVERALNAISERARRILELREYGYKYKEIADIMETTETAVKMQVKRAFERMKSALSD